jgi:hypothetical protein
MYPAGDVPSWVQDALAVAGIDLTGVVMDRKVMAPAGETSGPLKSTGD